MLASLRTYVSRTSRRSLPRQGKPGFHINYDETQFDAITGRGFFYGDEYYGTFTKALFTLFQVLTGESWCEAIARPLLFSWDYSGMGPGGSSSIAVIYFVSYVIICGFVLINVVVAVLLDKMVAPDDDEAGSIQEDEAAAGAAVYPETELTGPKFDGPADLETLMRNQAAIWEQMNLVMKKLDQMSREARAGSPDLAVNLPIVRDKSEGDA